MCSFLPDLGTYTFLANEGSLSPWFQAGVEHQFGFNQIEASRAFDCCLDEEVGEHAHPLCFWGKSYSHGSFLNKPSCGAEDLALAHDYAMLANDAIKTGEWQLTEAAEELIKSALVRYPDGNHETADQEESAVQYAKYLKEAAGNDLDLLTLYAEAEMDVMAIRGNGYYTENGEVNPGEPREETVRAMAALERVMRESEEDNQQPLALHLYIHITESRKPNGSEGNGAWKGLASAEALALMNVTDSGHLLHMPGHLFMRTGRYNEVVQSNILAHMADDLYDKVGMSPYGPAHNSYQLVAASSLDGQGDISIEYSEIIREIFLRGDVDDSPGVEEGWNTLLMIYLRFGYWEEIIKDDSWIVPEVFGLQEDNYGTFLGHYCRGQAFWQLGNKDKAKEELNAMLQMILDDKFDARATVAISSLRARVVGGEEGLKILKEAAEEQNGWTYNNPPLFIQPMNQCVGSYLLGMGEKGEAAHYFNLDLEEFPNNAWSLYGLFEATGKESYKEQAEKAWERGDIELVSACPIFA